ncbi:unnamed protein product [Amoebophrya sp. A120]|nr:unnamed protein product [Amoebophrya sp. A120]|eukprot:GSA120T00016123001.1
MLSTRRQATASCRGVLQRRGFFGVKSPVEASSGGVYVTKYQITKKGKAGVDYDDFLLTLPQRDQLASETKQVELFLKYLKVVTDHEARSDDFKDFLKRSKDGLMVESDVFITTEELLSAMWANGFAEKERTAVQYTFPAEYKFHYPELAVLFNISEEDCYKYCMRKRIEASHIGQLDSKKMKPGGWVRDHWLIFGASIFLLKTFPFFNYYFALKGFGTGMFLWTSYTAFSRYIGDVIQRNEFMAAQKTAQDVMEGEDKIMAAMKRFANDSKCLDRLASFSSDLRPTMASYRKALIEAEKQQLIAKAKKQLQSILSFEDSNGAKLQDSLVKEVKADFTRKFGTDASMQSAAFESALTGISGETSKQDPVLNFFADSLKQIDLSGKAKANASGSVSERLAFMQQQQEQEFVKTFYVTAEETTAVKSASDEAAKTKLMEQLYSKCGFHVPGAYTMTDAKPPSDSGSDYVKEVSDAVGKLTKELEQKRAASLQAAFA